MTKRLQNKSCKEAEVANGKGLKAASVDAMAEAQSMNSWRPTTVTNQRLKKNAPPKAKKGPKPQPRVRLRRVQWVSVQRKIHSFPGTHVQEPTHLDHCTARRLTKRSNGERMGLKRYGNARWNTLRPFLSEGILAAARPA